MASKAELLASARKKGSKQKIFRRGRGTNTSVRQPVANRNAGRDAQAVADFLGTMLKFGPGVLDAHNRETNEENKKLVAKGEATYKNATPDQRKQFRDNVRNGIISGGESPYFREGLRRAQADEMSLEYGNSVMLAWESSEAKNSADPEAFNNFLDEFQNKAEGTPGQNRSWQERIGDLGDHVANEEFWPKADAIKRQLSQMHSEHQRTEYTKKAQAKKDSSERAKFNDGSLENALVDPLAEQLLNEYVQDEHLSTHINILKESRNRLTKKSHKGSLKSQFISNAYSNGMNKKDALVAWNTKKHSLDVEVNNLSLENIGQASQNVFTTAAFVKEEKETQKELRYPTHGEAYEGAGYSSKASASRKKPAVQTEWYSRHRSATTTTDAPILSLVNEADEFDLGLSSIVAVEELETTDSAGVAATNRVAAVKQKLTDNITDSDAPSLDEPLTTALPLTQEAVNEEIAIAKGEPTETKVAPPVKKKSVAQPIVNTKTAIVNAVKEFEGISPDRTHYGLVAYETQDEAELMVEKIRERIVGDDTGVWELAVTKIDNVYQIQTQNNVNVTEDQKTAFFNKLASEYPGEMGNLKAGIKDKDYVQIIPPKKYKKKKGK